MTKDQGRVLLSSFVVGPSSFVVGTSSLDKVSPGSDQLYSWGGAEGAPRGYPGPSAPPQRWGFGADSPPQTPTQKCKVRKNLVLVLEHIRAARQLLGALLRLDRALGDLGDVRDRVERGADDPDRQAHEWEERRPALAVVRVDVAALARRGIVEQWGQQIEAGDSVRADPLGAIRRR